MWYEKLKQVVETVESSGLTGSISRQPGGGAHEKSISEISHHYLCYAFVNRNGLVIGEQSLCAQCLRENSLSSAGCYLSG
jgi:hypothetical protein